MDSPFSSSSPFSGPSTSPPRPRLTLGTLAKGAPALGDSVLVGIALHFIASGFDVPLVLPALAGAIIGYFIAESARRNKVRSKTALAILSIVCGLLCYGTRHITGLLQARESMIRATSTQRAGGNPKLKSQIESKLRSRITPLSYLPTYLRDGANRGFTLKSKQSYETRYVVHYDTPLHFFYGLLVVEALLAIGAAATVSWLLAMKVFCETCDEQPEEEVTIAHLYGDQTNPALHLLQRGDFALLIQLVEDDAQEGARDKRSVELRLAKCPRCAGGRAKMVMTRDWRFETLWESQVTPQEVVTLEEVREKWLEMADAKAALDSLSTS
jgi:hypothetical protein